MCIDDQGRPQPGLMEAWSALSRRDRIYTDAQSGQLHSLPLGQCGDWIELELQMLDRVALATYVWHTLLFLLAVVPRAEGQIFISSVLLYAAGDRPNTKGLTLRRLIAFHGISQCPKLISRSSHIRSTSWRKSFRSVAPASTTTSRQGDYVPGIFADIR